ncbi:hypothetical protein J6590_027347 [Homalodisca vitripennis]|nr:hypothetical protein J6590_027347 [Homalodisca vitripennis]
MLVLACWTARGDGPCVCDCMPSVVQVSPQSHPSQLISVCTLTWASQFVCSLYLVGCRPNNGGASGTTTPRTNHRLPTIGQIVSGVRQPPTTTPTLPPARRSVRQHPPDDKKNSDKVISMNANAVNVKTLSASSSSANGSDIAKGIGAKSGNGCAANVARGKVATGPTAAPTSAPSPIPAATDEVNTRRKTRSGAVGDADATKRRRPSRDGK